MKKWMALLFLLVMGLVGCQKEIEPLTIRITWKAYSGRGEAIEKVVNDSPGLFKMIGGDENLEAIRSELSEVSSAVFVLPYRYVKLLSEEGLLQSIDTSRIRELDQLYNPLLEFGKENNVTYGLPWLSHSMALIYNKTRLDDVGIDVQVIEDRASFISLLSQVEELTNMHGIGLVGKEHNDISWMVNQCIYGSGGALEKGQELALDSEQVRDGLLFYKSLADYAKSDWINHDGTDVMAAFRNEEVAFEIQGLWGITDIWKNGSPFEVGVLPLSLIKMHSEVGPMMLCMPKNLSHTEETRAYELINYMLSYEAQQALMRGEYSPEKDTYYPFRLSVRKDVLFETYDIFDIFYEAYTYPSIDVPSALWMKLKEGYYTKGLHDLMKNEITMDEFLNNVKTEYRRLK